MHASGGKVPEGHINSHSTVIAQSQHSHSTVNAQSQHSHSAWGAMGLVGPIHISRNIEQRVFLLEPSMRGYA